MTSQCECERLRRLTWRHESEQGSSLLGILSVVVTLGILVVITLSLNFGSSPSKNVSLRRGTAQAATTTVRQSIASGAQEATVVSCEADFATVSLAVDDYRALNGMDPPGGSKWASATTVGGPYMQSWPANSSAYSITWNGAIVSVVPVKGVASHGTDGSSSPPTSGCFAG